MDLHCLELPPISYHTALIDVEGVMGAFTTAILSLAVFPAVCWFYVLYTDCAKDVSF